MTLGIATAIAYGLLALVGGIFGYIKAKSKISLISGIASGTLLILGGIAQLQGQVWGLPLATAIAALLIVTFAIRLAKTRKMMPAGLMILAGIVAVAILLQQQLVV